MYYTTRRRKAARKPKKSKKEAKGQRPYELRTSEEYDDKPIDLATTYALVASKRSRRRSILMLQLLTCWLLFVFVLSAVCGAFLAGSVVREKCAQGYIKEWGEYRGNPHVAPWLTQMYVDGIIDKNNLYL